ncbi:MAG: 4-alpha-glucanotransferase, partial [Clostridia bacterium]
MRESGVILHISSLPSPYGIGTFGEKAYKFVDFLKKSKLKYWQVLPLNQTSFGDSPYQSPSAYAGNPYFIDLDVLIEEGLLQKSFVDSLDFGDDNLNVDYGIMFENRYKALRAAFEKFEKSTAYEEFCVKNSFWLDDYSLFMAIKVANEYKSFL